jgi:NTP pyrophosphatase (non-canonical NTP hydrolase)
MREKFMSSPPPPIQLARKASMQEYQRYIYQLEALHQWLDVDLVHNCFLMGEEVGELFKAIRKHQRFFVEEHSEAEEQSSREHIGEELVDVFNYLIAIANRLEIDLEEAFRRKNEINQNRSWDKG